MLNKIKNKSFITEIVEFNPKRTIKRGTVAPFVEMAALPENSRDIERFTEREFKSGGSRFQNSDTLFARITPCLENGKTAKVNILPPNTVAHGSTEFIVMAAKQPEIDEDFIYYLARLPEFREYAQARMEGTSGRQRVSYSICKQVQHSLISILGILKDCLLSYLAEMFFLLVKIFLIAFINRYKKIGLTL